MRPVFVGGCPRSGTTLLGSMLGAHDSALAIPESQFILDLAKDAEREFDPLATAEELIEHFRFKTWGVRIKPSSNDIAGVGSYPELIEWFVQQYGKAVDRSGREVWIEHSPWNAQYFGSLLELFPDAKLLHLVRDGRAVASSVMKLEWGPNEIHSAAPWWAQRLSFGLAAELHFGPDRVLQVRYEDLLVEPQATLEKICGFLDLDYQTTMIEADGLRVPEFTTRWHRLVGSKPDPARIEAWRGQLTARQIEIFENITGELLSYLGYRLDFGLAARAITRREKIVPFLKDHLFRRRANRARTKLANRRTEKAHEELMSPSADGSADSKE